jgi:hypothetical protein
MKWISDSEIVVNGNIIHITNPKWIKELEKIMENNQDNDLQSIITKPLPDFPTSLKSTEFPNG